MERERLRQSRSLLVLAFGNPLRGDDGAAHYAAQLLEGNSAFPGTVLCVHQLTPDLAATLNAYDRVIFLDARLPDVNNEVNVMRLEAETATPPGLGHTLSPAQLLAIARALDGQVPEAWLITIPAEEFAFGFSLSPTALRGAQEAARVVTAMALDQVSSI